MLPWLESSPAARGALEALTGVLGSDWRARATDSAWLSANRNAQRLIVGVSVATWQALAAELPPTVAVAGYSVGELSACCAAGVFDLPGALDLAQHRADAMDACTGADGGAMLAVTGMTLAAVKAACEAHKLSIAIRIGPQRCVLAGTPHQVQKVKGELDAAGATCSVLCVRVASHTPAMREAAAFLFKHVEPLDWRIAQRPVVCNVDGRGRRDPAALKVALCAQMAQMVQWDSCMDVIAERRPDCVLEVGPGTGLSRMWTARHPHIPARSVDEFGTLEAICQWVQRHQG